MKISNLFITIIFVVTTGCVSDKRSYSFPKIGHEVPRFSPPTGEVTNVYGEVDLPYSHICRFSVKRSKILWSKSANSTGTLLKNGAIVTAGHNFYSPFYNSVKNFKLEAGVGTSDNVSAKYSEYIEIVDSQSILVNPSYRWKPFGKDVAFVKTSQSSFSKSSPFRLATKYEIDLLKRKKDNDERIEIYVSGYPGEGNYQHEGKTYEYNQGNVLTHLKTTVRSISNNVLYYDQKTTFRGMSGSPVWILNEPNGEYVIVGVHVTNGGAYLFESEMLDHYQVWANQHLVDQQISNPDPPILIVNSVKSHLFSSPAGPARFPIK